MQVSTAVVEQEVEVVNEGDKPDDTATQKVEKKIMKKMKRFFHPVSLDAPAVFSFANEFEDYKTERQVMDPFEYERYQKKKAYKERRMQLAQNKQKAKDGDIDVDEATENSGWN